MDAAGNVYVAGATTSADFPTIAGAFQAIKPADISHESAFVTKLNASGTTLLYSTYLGGALADAGNAIAVDTSGNAYITGSTSSANFPTTAGAFPTTYQGGGNAFVTKLNTHPVTHYQVNSVPTSTTAGQEFAVTVTALDAFNTAVTNYTDTVHFSSSDTQAGLPADYTFTAMDSGTHAFILSLRSPGSQTLRLTDTADPSVVGQADALAEFGVTGRVVNRNRTSGITYNPADGNYWFTELDASLISRITPSGTVTEFNFLPANAHPNDIFATPQGVLYFAETGGFGKYNPMTQQYTAYPTPGDTGYGFALGADGNLWFADSSANKIARFNPGTGMITEFAIPTANSGLHGITYNPADGNLWFAEYYGSKIGRISTAGSVTEFPTPTPNAGPYEIAVGSDGNLWFGETNFADGTKSRIGRMTTAGTATDFLIPTAASWPVGITAGPDGNIWFTEGAVGRIGQITTAGVVTDFALPNPGSSPYRIASGPDGSLWFTEAYGTKIGRLTPTITVTPAPPPTHFAVAAVSSTTAGSPFSVTVVALDANNNVVPAYAGKVHFASGDLQAGLPADYTFTPGDRGIHTFTNVVALKTAGYQTLTVTDAASGTLTGAAIVSVSPAAASTLMGSGFPSPTTASVAGTFTVTAKDAYGNIATAYTGTVTFRTSDPQAMLPADYSFTAADQSRHSFTATFKTASTYTLRATDTGAGSLFGEQTGIVVRAAPASQFKVDAPSTSTAGSAFGVTVTAQDPYRNVDTGYRGTVCVKAPSDPNAVLPPCYSYTASDNGVHTFPVTLKTAGQQILAVDAGMIHGAALVNVAPAPASKFVVRGFPSPSVAGVAGMFTVIAYDDYGNVATAYRGTAHFTSTDPQATSGNGLPADYPFTADNGVHTFTATLKTAGTQSLIATDTVTARITGSQTGISITPATASRLMATLPAAVVQGLAGRLTVMLLDAYNNIAIGYRGTVHVTAPTDPQAILPADYTFTAADAGVHTLPITFLNRGNQNAVVADTVNSNLSGIAGTTAGSLFQPAATYPAGATPASLVAADLNGDGILDLVLANGGANTVSVLLGNADGTFQPAASYPAGADAAAVVGGDFNGDGIPDLAVVNNTTNSVSILLGNGDGSFQARAAAYTVGAQPVPILAVDLNGDGVLDVVTANAGGHNVSVLLGNGDGTFQTAQAYAAGMQPSAVGIADINGDGLPDLVVSDAGGNQVEVLLGVGDGSLRAPMTFATGTGPSSVVVGDFNGDGNLDVAVTNQADGTVSVLLRVAGSSAAPGASDTHEPGVNGRLRLDAALGIELGYVARLQHRAVDDLFAGWWEE